jgi:hypothetical protein
VSFKLCPSSCFAQLPPLLAEVNSADEGEGDE